MPDRITDEITWLNTRAVADKLNVTVETVRRWIKEKGLPGVQIPGDQWRIRSVDLDAWLAGESVTLEMSIE